MDTVLSDTITFQGVSVPILTPQLTAVQDLPDPEEGVLLIVSALTKGASNRKDLVSPGEVVRNEKGHIIGARALLTSEERL